jgi:FHS family glucose/mannose:H+ symporter-like MFS transporter
MNFRHKLIIPSSDLAIGMCGVYLGTYQISLLQITQYFNLDPVMKGVLIALQYTGLCLPPLFLGTLSERIGKKGVVAISLPLMILGVALITLTNQLGLFITGILLCGAGYSVAEGTLTATLGVEFKEKSALHLGLSQVCFSLGAVLSPLWCDALFKAGYTYHHAFGLVGIALIVTYVLFLFTRHEHDIKGSANSGIGQAFRFFSQKTFLLIAVSIFMAVGIEEVIAFYMGSYMELTLSLPAFSALALSLFWAGMIPSRLFLGAIKLPHKTFFTICGAGIAISALGVMAIPVLEVRLALFALLGLFTGPTWPLIMDIAAKAYPQNAGAVSNVMLSLGCVGGIAVPLLVGALVVGANYVPMFIATAFCGVVMAVAFRLSSKKYNTHKNT